MTGHMDGTVLNHDSECPGRGSRTPAVRARSFLSQPSDAPPAGPDELRLDRTRVLELIPNTLPNGRVGVIPCTVGVAGVAVAQILGRDAVVVQ